MTIENGDILRLALSWRFGGTNQMVNVHTVRVESGGGGGDDEAFMNEVADETLYDLYDIINGAISEVITGDVITGLNLTRDAVLPTVSWNLDGEEVVSDSNPSQTGPLVYLNSGTPRRQARVYLPPFAETQIDGLGTISGAALTALVAFGAYWLAPLVSTSLSLQRVIGTSLAAGFVDPTSAGISLAVRSQRRRTQGFGS